MKKIINHPLSFFFLSKGEERVTQYPVIRTWKCRRAVQNYLKTFIMDPQIGTTEHPLTLYPFLNLKKKFLFVCFLNIQAI